MTSQCRLPVYEQNKTLLPGLYTYLVNTIQPLVRLFCIFLRVFLLWFPTQQPMLRLYTLRDFSIKCVARMLTWPEYASLHTCAYDVVYTIHFIPVTWFILTTISSRTKLVDRSSLSLHVHREYFNSEGFSSKYTYH